MSTGISVQLPGTSSLGARCGCPRDLKQWKRREDGFSITLCDRCNTAWHYCPIHYVEVEGLPNYSKQSLQQCSCRKPWMPQKNLCPHCRSLEYLKPYDNTSTRICGDCRESYHVCPVDGNSVPGPGYPLTAREQTMCQCHQNPPFLGNKWGSPYN